MLLETVIYDTYSNYKKEVNEKQIRSLWQPYNLANLVVFVMLTILASSDMFAC